MTVSEAKEELKRLLPTIRDGGTKTAAHDRAIYNALIALLGDNDGKFRMTLDEFLERICLPERHFWLVSNTKNYDLKGQKCLCGKWTYDI